MDVVYCKDCKKRHLGFGFCPMVHHAIENPLMIYELNEDDDFCSRGEPKEVTNGIDAEKRELD